MKPEVRTREQYWGNYEPKEAEAANTHVMPAQSQVRTKSGRIPIPKTASLHGTDLKGETSDPPESVDMEGVSGEQPDSNPQSKQINPRVNVTDKEPPKEVIEKKASRYALPSFEKYPLDSYRDVENAVDYFEKWGSQFVPRHRHEFCINLSERAEELGIKVSHVIKKYGSRTYAPYGEVEAALDNRKLLVNEENRMLLDKLSSARPFFPADVFVEALVEFDKTAGIDHLYHKHVMDPFLSVYGVKTAEDEGVAHVIGNDTVSNVQLKKLSETPCESMLKTYGEDFVKEFRKDPVGIFNSLPVDQKKLVCRMANDLDVG